MRRGGHGVSADEGADPYVPGHGDRSYDVAHYDLELDYRVSSNHLDASAVLAVTPRERLRRIALDLHGLSLAKVTVDGRRPARYARRGGRLLIDLAESAIPGQRLEVAVRYSGQPGPLTGPWGEVGWEELDDGVIVAGQPDGAPSWFPCNDRPDSKATYRVSVTTESAYAVLANGRLVQRRAGASRTTWVYQQATPMAPYLATVQIGRYDEVELRGSDVPQTFLAPAQARARAAHDLERQPQMIEVFEELFGAYPFDGYRVVVTADDLEIPLEAQGLSIFGANHMDGHRTHERLVAHELAHQWFGNSLTVSRWKDIWLHEGFACYAEWLWSERSGGPSADEHAAKHWQRLASAPQDLVLSDPGPDLMFDDRLYKRGALTLHALRHLLGDEEFFALLRRWVRDHTHGTVSTTAFWSLAGQFGDVSEVSALLGAWLDRPALPPLT